MVSQDHGKDLVIIEVIYWGTWKLERVQLQRKGSTVNIWSPPPWECLGKSSIEAMLLVDCFSGPSVSLLCLQHWARFHTDQLVQMSAYFTFLLDMIRCDTFLDVSLSPDFVPFWHELIEILRNWHFSSNIMIYTPHIPKTSKDMTLSLTFPRHDVVSPRWTTPFLRVLALMTKMCQKPCSWEVIMKRRTDSGRSLPDDGWKY